MKDLNALHRKHCPTKCLSNFWRSADYLSAARVVGDMGELPKQPSVSGGRNNPSMTMVHPLVAVAFLRWSDADLFYRRLSRIVKD